MGLIWLGRGGLVWLKGRSDAFGHVLSDTVRGATKTVYTHSTYQQETVANSLTSFNNTGFSLGFSPVIDINNNTKTFASWTFRKANKFFDVQTVTVSGGVTATVDLSSLTTVGMVAVKRTDSTSAWFVYHRSCTATKLVYLNTTAAETSDASISLSGTTLSLLGGTIPNGTYIVYAWAHDTTANTGMIQCGTYTDTADFTVTLGWEPQYVLVKVTNTTGSWTVQDSMRGLVTDGTSYKLKPDTTDSESGTTQIKPTATGFRGLAGLGNTYVYMAIRRPNKPPTSGTQVYNAIARAGTQTVATVTGVGFAPDMVITTGRTNVVGNPIFTDRLRGANIQTRSDSMIAESTYTDVITGYGMDGVMLGNDLTTGFVNYSPSQTYINWFFKRAPEVFDEVCYSGTASASLVLNHSLGVSPELIIIKCRSTGGDASRNWYVSTTGDLTKHLFLNTTAAYGTTEHQVEAISSTTFQLRGNENLTSASGDTYVAYLFATKAGISKVGSYTGNGSTQTIDCGFSAGARFILVKRTDSTGAWFVFDNTRGIVAAEDPHLSLNTAAAEVTTDDSVDPDVSGFKVNELAATHINVTSATYIFLAMA